MVEFPELEQLGGQLRALKEAERLLAKQPVKTDFQDLQLAELRALIRQRKHALKKEVERVQLRLSF